VTAATHLLGWLALALLASSLGVSLATRWQTGPARARGLRLRRAAGLGGAALALVHALVSLALFAPPDLAGLFALLEGLPFLRHGALALALLAPLVATSFPALHARLGLRGWSALHRLVYAAVALAALHVLGGPSADPRIALAASILVALLFAARLVPRRAVRADGAVTTGSRDSP
jgi:sulfoxide reductase heme-binding subunit YedZ